MSRLTEKATAFVTAIVNGDAGTAHEMLISDLSREISAADLTTQLDAMADDMGGVTKVGDAAIILEEWPGKTENELAMVYVPLEGDVYSEAITLTLAKSGDELRISRIEWGRP